MRGYRADGRLRRRAGAAGRRARPRRRRSDRRRRAGRRPRARRLPRSTDVAGRSLPGLIDTHVHLCGDSGLAGAGPVRRAVRRRAARRSSRHRGAAAPARRRDRRSATSATTGGPSSSGPATGDGPDRRRLRAAASPPRAGTAGRWAARRRAWTRCAAAVRERAERGADVVKIMASGGVMTPGHRPARLPVHASTSCGPSWTRRTGTACRSPRTPTACRRWSAASPPASTASSTAAA